MSRLKEYYKKDCDMKPQLEKLKKLIDEKGVYLDSEDTLNEIHSTAWFIQVMTERMLKVVDLK
jgi:hypothetical protein